MDALKPGEDYGVSLLSPLGRTWFVQMMACIRAEILKREIPKRELPPSLPKLKSDAIEKDPDPSKLRPRKS